MRATADPRSTADLRSTAESNYQRQSGKLYSGDIINIMTTVNGRELAMQRGIIDSQVIMSEPLPKTVTNLSKLRFELAKPDQNRQVGIRYGDSVFLLHNAYSNNTNEVKHIKYGERLQSHQEGPMYRTFEIIDPNKVGRRDLVELEHDIILTGAKSGHLKVESDGSVSSSAKQSDATKFKLELVRAFELHNRNLCVAPNEVLYP